MNKVKNLLLALTSLTLASCGAKECINHIDANHDGKCDVCEKEVPVNHVDNDKDGKCDVCGKEINHVDNNDDNICDICGADLSKEITIDTVLKTDKWNQDLRDMIGYLVGKDNAKLIPAMPAPEGYKCYLEETPYGDGSGSQVACYINCYGIDPQTALSEYDEILTNAGFFLGYSSDYGYKILTPTKDLIVQYQVITVARKTFIELCIYTAETRLLEWPKEQVKELLGVEIPVYKADSYEFYYYIDMNYSPIATIYDHNTGVDGLVNYHNQIMATGDYTLTANTADGYEYLSKDGKIILGIYPAADEYNRDSIYITIENNWPYLWVTSMLGEDIPCYNASAMEWMFQDLDEDGTAEYLTIFYDGATHENFLAHCGQFQQAGWTLDETESDENYKVYTKEVDNKVRVVEVVYNEAQSAICVAFTD